MVPLDLLLDLRPSRLLEERWGSIVHEEVFDAAKEFNEFANLFKQKSGECV